MGPDRTFLASRGKARCRARARPGLTQPTVSRHVDALEGAVGIQLFVRSGRVGGHGGRARARSIMPKPWRNDRGHAADRIRTRSGRQRTVRVSASEIMAPRFCHPSSSRCGNSSRAPNPAVAVRRSRQPAAPRRDTAVRMVEPAQEALVIKRIGSVTLASTCIGAISMAPAHRAASRRRIATA